MCCYWEAAVVLGRCVLNMLGKTFLVLWVLLSLQEKELQDWLTMSQQSFAMT